MYVHHGLLCRLLPEATRHALPHPLPQVRSALAGLGVMDAVLPVDAVREAAHGALAPDLALDLGDGGPPVALEVENPYAYSVNAPYVPVGATVLRRALLAKAGFRLVTLPFFELEEGGGAEPLVMMWEVDPAAFAAYIARKLGLEQPAEEGPLRSGSNIL